jgi:glutamate dehydrogenase
MLNFLSDEDLEGFILHLFKILETRSNKNMYMQIDNLDDMNFFIGNFSLISIVTDDRPFLYDSIWGYLQELDSKNLFIVHPIFNIERDSEGKLKKVSRTTIGSKNESFVMVFLENTESNIMEKIGADVKSIYENAMAAVDDFHRMTELMHNLATEFRENEPDVSRFIHWLLQDNFIFQGARVIDIDKDSKSFNCMKFGIFKLDDTEPDYDTILSYIEEDRFNFVDGYPVVVDKSLLKSKMKEHGHLNRILFVDKSKSYVRVVCLLGLIANKGRRSKPHEIPILKEKVKSVLDEFNFVHGSHDYKWVRDLIDNFPKVELFNFNTKLMVEMLELILSMQGANQIRICYRDFKPLNNVFFFVAMPADKYSYELIQDMKAFLESYFNAKMLDISVRNDEHKRYYLHFHMFVHDIDALDKVDENIVKNSILALMRNWETNLYDLLRERLGGSEVDRIYHKYIDRFSDTYRSRNSAEATFSDIKMLEGLEGVNSRLYTEDGSAILKIYSDTRYLVTQLIPIIDNIGLKVYEEDTYEFSLYEGKRFVNTVYFADIENVEDFVARYKTLLPQLMTKVLSHFAENDKLNALAISEDLTYRQIGVLRGLRNFIRQIESSFTLKTLNNALINNSDTAKLLVNLFEEKFNPEIKKPAMLPIIEQVNDNIEKVVSVIEDKALRYYLKVIDGILRTNYFRKPERPYISFKIASKEMDIVHEPKPMFEIFVHSAQMDGVHLRGGKVARGGLRFSDRLDDYRTEVLGLVKAQMVKNAVIVPVGSKGGFIVKKRFADRAKDKENVQEQYKNYIRGLFDVTDNLKLDEVVHPEDVKVYDDKDPYLVVAADKGTATFSDLANSISMDKGFWLGDGFASGGSTGYDHKKVGITAKGAWESVKRHFRELGKDIQNEEFTVAAIGDMAGDVFGNGMLLSRKIKLQAAFNHMHIFIDPDPDPEKSFIERERLFELATAATWMDYDRSVLSDGGGIFERSAKRIELNSKTKKMLGTDKKVVTGEELINLILKMEAELLWNGGIGTYIRATTETNAQVGDPANDNVRIDGSECRFKVIGEGGNLGLTQKARMEICENGVLVNTDALDNSAGVDMSDHEVNLKIMFDKLLKEGLIGSVDERNAYIEKLTPDVEKLVLSNNYHQSMCVSSAGLRYQANPVVFRELARYLNKKGLLDFGLEYIEFVFDDKTPTRPELCVLLAYAKIFLYNSIEQELDVNNELVKKEYLGYYPEDVQKRFGDKLFEHALMREIASTVVVNRLTNQAGATFFFELFKNNSVSYAKLAESYLLAEDILGCKQLRNDLENLDNKAEAKVIYEALIEIEKTIKVAVTWLVDDSRKEMMIAGRETFEEIVKLIPKSISEDMKQNYDEMVENFTSRGIPQKLAKAVCNIRYIKSAFDIFEISVKKQQPIKNIISKYYELGYRISINDLTNGMKSIRIKTEWERVNLESILIRVKLLQKQIVEDGCAKDKNWLDSLFESEKTFFDNYEAFLQTVREGEIDSLVPYNVILDMFSNLSRRFEDS